MSFLDQEMLATLLDPALPRIDERPCPQGFSCVSGLLFACTDGESFAPSEGSSSCSTCGTCLTGQLVLQACTRESDTVCSSCPRFSTERGDKCVCDNNLSLNDRDEAVEPFCECPAGQYILLSDEEGASCVDCEEGMDCIKGLVESSPFLQSVPLMPGFWRQGPDAVIVTQCDNEGACTGGNDTSLQCRANHKQGSPYCSVCEDGFYTSLNTFCEPCTGEVFSQTIAISAGVLVFLIPVLICMCCGRSLRMSKIRNYSYGQLADVGGDGQATISLARSSPRRRHRLARIAAEDFFGEVAEDFMAPAFAAAGGSNMALGDMF